MEGQKSTRPVIGVAIRPLLHGRGPLGGRRDHRQGGLENGGCQYVVGVGEWLSVGCFTLHEPFGSHQSLQFAGSGLADATFVSDR
jgi:hypothetical protein